MSRLSLVLASLLIVATVATGLGPFDAEPAHAFGSANILGQRAEHERVTRRAIGCGTYQKERPCFESYSIYNLAGGSGYFGAVGAPDNYPARGFRGGPDRWHCDNADFFAAVSPATYPRSRAQATAALQDCWNFIHDIQSPGVPGNPDASPDWATVPVSRTFLNGSGKVDISDPGGGYLTSCSYNGKRGRVKCEAFESMGYRFHAIQDFYSHSNWADLPGGGAQGVSNPPGLGKTTTFFDTRKPFNLPDQRLSTGCFPSDSCANRIRHNEEMNKDKGDINVATGGTSDPITPRGKVVVSGRSNFDRAVAGAVNETRYQWTLLRGDLIATYGSDGGSKRVCALWRDRSSLCNRRSVALAVSTDDRASDAGSDLIDGLGSQDDDAVQIFDGTGNTGADNSDIGDDDVDPDQGGGGAADALQKALYSAEDALVDDQRANPQRAVPTGPGGDTIPPDVEIPEEETPEIGATPPSPIVDPPPPPVPDPTRQGGVVLTSDDDVGDVGDLVDVVHHATRDGVPVSIAIVGQGWAPGALARAVDANGGTLISTRRADDDTAETLEASGLTPEDDGMGNMWGPLLEPGAAPVEGITDGSEDQYPLLDSGEDQQLVLSARDDPVTVEAYNAEAGTTEKITAEQGDPATLDLDDDTQYEIRAISAGGRQFELAVR